MKFLMAKYGILFIQNYMNIRAWTIFTIVWGILVYIIALKLNPPLGVLHFKAFKKINTTFKQLHKSNQKNLEILNFIENYLNNIYKKTRRRNFTEDKFIENLEHELEYFENILNYERSLKKVSNYASLQPYPSLDYEQLRRRIKQNNQEMCNYFYSQLKGISYVKKIKDKINNLLELSAVHKRSLISDIDQMRSVDGYELWRQQEAEELSNVVQKRLNLMQNRLVCNNVKKLLCNINLECGFGCQIHHIAKCFIIAYSTERTMVLRSRHWLYHKAGFQEIFQEVSNKCTDYIAAKNYTWAASYLAYRQMLSFLPEPYFVLGIPKDLVARLTKLHGAPTVWWISQFLKYLLRPKHRIQEMLEINMEKIGWKKPIVGIHIRRSDKIGTEASFHSVKEYMTYVEEYYLTLEIQYTNIERRIFVATDDPQVITDIRLHYPEYIILCDQDAAEIANISTRYTNSSIYGLISDIHMLSLSDYLVCTFSSQICRLAYEIMQTYHPDASDRSQSIDDIYYFPGQNDHNLEVILSHNPRNKNEIFIKPGDIIHVLHQHHGFSTGINRRTHNNGSFPSFKVKNIFEIVYLPIPINIDYD